MHLARMSFVERTNNRVPAIAILAVVTMHQHPLDAVAPHRPVTARGKYPIGHSLPVIYG